MTAIHKYLIFMCAWAGGLAASQPSLPGGSFGGAGQQRAGEIETMPTSRVMAYVNHFNRSVEHAIAFGQRVQAASPVIVLLWNGFEASSRFLAKKMANRYDLTSHQELIVRRSCIVPPLAYFGGLLGYRAYRFAQDPYGLKNLNLGDKF